MLERDKSICDENEFDRFYSTHVRGLRNYIFYKFGDADQSDDVVQEAFIRLWKNCTKVTLDSAKSFLYRIAINLSMGIKRSDKVKLRYREQVIKSDGDNQSPEFLLLEKEFMEKLMRAIDRLPEKQREVFLMNRVEKKTYLEIAEISGVTVKAIEKSMHKALLKLREEFGNI